MLEFDFFKDAIDYIDSKEKLPQKPKEKPLVCFKETGLQKGPVLLGKNEQKQVGNKPYTIDINKGLITIKGQVYNIPSYYNRDMIKEGDKKTIDMVLISLGHINLIEPDPKPKKKKFNL